LSYGERRPVRGDPATGDVQGRRARKIVYGAVAAAAFLGAACGGLAHPVSNEGADAGNPNGANPGTTILTINASRTPLSVGDTASIVGNVGGMPIANNGAFQSTSSDPSVLFVGGTALFARSAGTATINATYNGYAASPPLTVTVYPAANGAYAVITVQNTEPPAFAPASVYVKVGAQVQFSVGTAHNVVFDVLAGAPQNVQTGAGSVLRAFSVTGMFTYQCTIHGESGVVNVTQ
jgi:plastocyanin